MLFEKFRDVCINSMYERSSGWQGLIIEWSHIEFSSFTSDSVCMHCVAASLCSKKSQSPWICNVQYEKLSCEKLNLWSWGFYSGIWNSTWLGQTEAETWRNICKLLVLTIHVYEFLVGELWTVISRPLLIPAKMKL